MDFRNLCQKMNMDGVRAKLPSLPTMPQLQFPKALPKLKSRKIFRSSNNDFAERDKNSPRSQSFAQQEQQCASLAPPIPPATFINHTPTRISTISSLIHEQGDSNIGASAAGNTYCSAFSVDDDYPSPRPRRQYEAAAAAAGARNSWPTSPIRMSNSPKRTNAAAAAGGPDNRNVHMSITEKLQKGYKDISEFRMKYIFAKKTVLRKDEIQVNDYVLQYDEERRREQLEDARHDQNIADNYKIKFTMSNSRQNTIESDDDDESMKLEAPSMTTGVRQAPPPPKKKQHAMPINSSECEHSGDESDMETTPPAFKPGIAATRFLHVRSPPLKMPSIDDEESSSSPPTCNLATKSSGLNEATTTTTTTKPTSKSSDNNHMRRLMNYLSLQEEPKKADAAKSCDEKMSSPNAMKTVCFEQETKTESPAANIENRPLETIKHNVKLLQQKFIKHMRTETAPNTDDSDYEGAAAVDAPQKKRSQGDGRWSQLRRFKSTKEDANKPKDSVDLRRKLKTWKKSFKINATEVSTACDECSPDEKIQERRSDKLIKKLKYMSTRLSTTSKSEQEDECDGAQAKTDGKTTQKNWHGTNSRHMASNTEENFIQAREETMKKVTNTNNNKCSRNDFESDGQETLPWREMQINAHQLQNHNNVAELNSDQVHHGSLDNSSDDELQDAVQFSDNSNKVPPAINARRRYLNTDYEYYTEQNEIEPINAIQTEYAKRHNDLYGASTLTAWTTKPILCQESLDSDTESEFPRVLIHQDHSDAFESTLIIAVTRPTSASLSPHIDEILPQKRNLTSLSVSPEPLTDAAEWVPNKQIISSFLASNTNTIVRDPSLSTSILSSTENVSSCETSSKGEQNRHKEKADPWLTQSDCHEMQKLKKTKTIDIFETNSRNGGAKAAFEDFDDELRYEPVVKIFQNLDNSEHDRSEMYDTPEDDNSSRVSNISLQTVNENKTLLATKNIFTNKQSSSRESLVGHLSEDRSGSTDEGNDDDDDDEANDDDECFENDCPPSNAPSEPPSSSSSPQPYQHQKSTHVAPLESSTEETVDLPSKEYEDALLLPLRTSKPTIPEHQVPLTRPPELTSSMTHLARPLVKTASLRLAYSEQVNPDDIGKVNKLISRFETPGKKNRGRPRITSRRMISQDSEECSDYEMEKKDNAMTVASVVYDEERPDLKSTQITVTTTVVNRSSMPPVTLTATQQSAINSRNTKTATIPEIITTRDTSTYNDNNNDSLDTTIDQLGADFNKSTLGLDRKNSNCSRSEYGSPLAYSLSWRGSYETTPVPERKQQQQHQRHTRYSRRSMTKDDDNFYSFDSDEENSYYSISPSDSSRYVVEI